MWIKRKTHNRLNGLFGTILAGFRAIIYPRNKVQPYKKNPQNLLLFSNFYFFKFRLSQGYCGLVRRSFSAGGQMK